MRGREFIMKDGYSFDCDDEGASRAFQDSSDAITASSPAWACATGKWTLTPAPSAARFSHEFHVLAEAGEDTIASCTSCRYAANIERCEVVWKGEKNTAGCAPMEKVATPGAHTVADVARFLGVPVEQVVKTMIFNVDGKPVAILVRGDRQVNDVKVKNMLGARWWIWLMKKWSGPPRVLPSASPAPSALCPGLRRQRAQWAARTWWAPTKRTNILSTWISSATAKSRISTICASPGR